MQRIVAAFSFALLAGCSASAPPPVAPSVARAPYREASYRAASSLYRTAYRTKNPVDYRAAADAFDHYLAEYTESPYAYSANELDADARYAIEDWARAAQHFQRAIAIDARAKDSEELAYANVLATRYAAGLRDDGGDRDCTDEPKSAEKIPSEEAPILAAYDLYLKVATPTEKTRPTILFLKGRLLHSCAHFSEAETIFTDIVDGFSDSPEAPAGAALLLDCIAKQGKWAEMKVRLAKLEATPLASDPILADVLREARALMRKASSS